MMKKNNYTILLFFGLSVLFFSCEEDRPENIEKLGLMTAKKNKELWEPQIAEAYYTKKEGYIAVAGEIYDDTGTLRERLIFDYVPFEPGKYTLPTLNDDFRAGYTTLHGDVMEDRFIVLNEEENYFEITTIDLENMEIGGQFKITFIRNPDDTVTNPNLPDTIRFAEGDFLVRFHEQSEE